jgi:hypothetical protein
VVGGDRARASGKRASAAGRRRVAGGEPIRAPDAEGEPAPLLLALSLSNPESYHVHHPTVGEPCHVSTRTSGLWNLDSGLWTLDSGLCDSRHGHLKVNGSSPQRHTQTQ